MDTLTGFDTQSLLYAPLIYHNSITGVIEIVNQQNDAFSHADTSLLEAVAAITAITIENARLFSHSQTQVNDLSALNDIGLTLTTTLDPEKVTHIALDKTLTLFHAIGVALIQEPPTGGTIIAQGKIYPQATAAPNLLLNHYQFFKVLNVSFSIFQYTRPPRPG